MQHYYIMNAKCLFDDKKTDVAGVVGAWGNDQTILVCRRGYGSQGNEQLIFVSGSGTGYVPKGTELPIDGSYTEDTGMGHRNHYKDLVIENVIEVVNGVLKPRNMIGVNDKRIAWTMK